MNKIISYSVTAVKLTWIYTQEININMWLVQEVTSSQHKWQDHTTLEFITRAFSDEKNHVQRNFNTIMTCMHLQG